MDLKFQLCDESTLGFCFNSTCDDCPVGRGCHAAPLSQKCLRLIFKQYHNEQHDALIQLEEARRVAMAKREG